MNNPAMKRRAEEERPEEAKKRRVEYKNVTWEVEEQTPNFGETASVVYTDDFSDPLLIEYKEKLLKSEGFHAIALPPHLEVQTNAHAELNDEILQQVSEAAINFYNEANQGLVGSDFVLHSVIMGNWNDCSGRLYRVTFRARPSKSNHIDEHIKEFEAEVKYCPSEKKIGTVLNCTVKINLEYPLDFEHKDLLEFSDVAVQFFNQKHEGSHFVLHSVIKGNYTPIVGYPFRITFRARASSEEDTEEFEATLKLNFPCRQSRLATVIECTLKGKTEYSIKPECESSKGKEEDTNTAESEKAMVVEQKTVAEFVESKMEEKTDVKPRVFLKKFVQLEDLSPLLLKEYMKLMAESEAFRKLAMTMKVHSVYSELTDWVLRDVSKSAIKFYNEANEGSDFVFHSVVMCTFVLCYGKIYDITFRARPSKSKSNDDDDINEFQAITRYDRWKRIRVPVLDCIVKPELEYPIYFEHKELVEFSKDALEFFNQKHKGSHDFVLHSVINSSYYTHMNGYSIFVTFKAFNDGDEDDIKLFTAKLRLNRKSRPATVLECFLSDVAGYPLKPEFDGEEAIVAMEERLKEKNKAESGKAMVEKRFEEETANKSKDYADPLLADYKKKMRDSNGFYAIPLPRHLEVLVSVFPEYDEKSLQIVSKAAIKFFNEANGSDFVFHSVVMGNYYSCAFRYHHITFRARPSKSNDNDYDDIKEFEVRALYSPWKDNPVSVDSCTVKPKREYPLDFEHKELVEFSEEALKFFNQKHEGSHFVFHSVVKCSNYTPIGGNNVCLTFKASNNGDEEDIQEFDARLRLKLPWSLSKGGIVFECDLKDDKAENLERPESESESESFKGKEAVGAN